MSSSQDVCCIPLCGSLLNTYLSNSAVTAHHLVSLQQNSIHMFSHVTASLLSQAGVEVLAGILLVFIVTVCLIVF